MGTRKPLRIPIPFAFAPSLLLARDQATHRPPAKVSVQLGERGLDSRTEDLGEISKIIASHVPKHLGTNDMGAQLAFCDYRHEKTCPEYLHP